MPPRMGRLKLGVTVAFFLLLSFINLRSSRITPAVDNSLSTVQIPADSKLPAEIKTRL
jgi:hypothetical protein